MRGLVFNLYLPWSLEIRRLIVYTPVMAKTPEELEKQQTDLAAAIADLQKKISDGFADADARKELAELKAAFTKMAPAEPEKKKDDQPPALQWYERFPFNPFGPL